MKKTNFEQCFMRLVSVFLCIIMFAASSVPLFADSATSESAIGIANGACYVIKNKSSGLYLTLPGYTDNTRNVYQDKIRGNDQYSRIVEVNYNSSEGKYTLTPYLYKYLDKSTCKSR